MSVLPVIMAGGTGSRLWPLSREHHPKQFLSIEGKLSMLQNTIMRLAPLSVEAPVVICNDKHRFLVAEQLRAIDKLANNIILEPVGRNTAPAIALAAFCSLQNSDGEDPLLLVLAADHVIRDEEAFIQAIKQAEPLAEQGKLVTFGIVPTQAETGYGYILRGEAIGDDAFTVAEFVEKPDFDTACHYLASGKYYWNSGMFLFRVSSYLNELKKLSPDIYSACEKAVGHINPDLDFIRINKEAFSLCPSDSIDYAVMEHTHHAVVVPMSAGWSDVGSWSSLWDISEKDQQRNVLHGDVFTHNSKDNYIYSENSFISTVGVSNLVIIQTADALLVSSKDSVQDVKKIVDYLKNNNRTEYKQHLEVFRPWGKYNVIDSGDNYLVKRISVKPGEKFVAQMHQHRAEHWIVVSGTARVTKGEQTFIVSENESTFIPLNTIHALENPGVVPLELIEIQSGTYLGEDDIIRLEQRSGFLEEGTDEHSL
ncbi:TPA: mannose-1-phosphate guanylyltransferase/mannose-6-phosphate isomerase [Citrobacter braakii]|uniref:mannose-1-phosphate guanylyltransferase n=1 Tax=Citrobacter murliniae TaxID=67829 RepID=A0ABY2PUB0_9ENTR|nr:MULTISPECIES: mannose-1-phosphate guanylyltransferase/mannose-6-phosphate isomerase [Citrobacter]KLV66674.1 mannose-1-phosphate guanylyltransferase RfbM [Citrobacter sp. MGH106]MDM2941663.1 mannose-1-phosphate guanylyltransferase/mannose-6-phosphate isomerase [Citrobacter sp. Cm038]THE38353.1 mannose-1-phosphate guanylyltransferase/mannose-6-phosphate isomerase [Citrobacter murliniae]